MKRAAPRVLLQDAPTLVVAVVVAATIATVGWQVFRRDGAEKPALLALTHLHCPTCKSEMPYVASKEGKPCEACVVGSPLVATQGSLKEMASPGSSRAIGRIVGVALFLSLILEAFWLFCVFRLRSYEKAIEREQNRTLTCRCPFCNQKIRFAAAKLGAGVLCSKCKTAFTLTTDETDDPL